MSMPMARSVETGEIVAAEDLRERPGIRLVKFACAGCDIEVRPTAVGSVIVKPHFRRPPGVYHAGDCLSEDQVELRERARREPVLDGPNPPIPVFARLVLPAVGTGLAMAAPPTSSPEQRLAEQRSKVERRDQTASRLEPIVRQFLDFPQDRGLPLELPGAKGTYGSLFVPVQDAWRERYPGHRIFYAKVGFNDFMEQGRVFTIPLAAGQYSGRRDEKPLLRHKDRVYLKMDARAWHPQTIKSFRAELEAARRLEVQRTDKSGMIFFMGRHDPVNPLVFHAAPRRLVAIMKGAYPQHGRKPGFGPRPVQSAGAAAEPARSA